MSPASAQHGLHRLSLRWRRALVVTVGSCALLLTVLELTMPPDPETRSVLRLFSAAGILTSLWLLADSIWPWVGGDRVDPEERAHADYALRRAYCWLFVTALAGLVYLQLAETRPVLRPETPHQMTVLLWSIIGLVVLLPGCLYAWGARADDGAPEMGPLRLLRARLTGPSAALHGAALVSLLAALPLLLIGGHGVGPGGGVPANAALILALAAIAVAAWTGARAVLADRRQRTDGRGR